MDKSDGMWIKLTDKDLERLIDREAKERLNMSGQDFIAGYRNGTLPDTTAVSDIGMLLELGEA